MTQAQRIHALTAIDRMQCSEKEKDALRSQVNAGNPSALFVLLARKG